MKKSIIVSYNQGKAQTDSFKAANKSGELFKSKRESLYDQTSPGGGELFKSGADDVSRNKELITIEENLTGMNEWDLAHLYYDSEKKGGNNQIAFIEPDIEEPYKIRGDQENIELFKSGNKDDCAVENYDPDWAAPNTVMNWHGDDSHSQLVSAWKEVNVPGSEEIVVAIMDTGFDPNHVSAPATILAQKSFVEGENPDSAVDPWDEGFLKQPRHGTATLAVLAGKNSQVKHVTNGASASFWFEGGYPGAKIIPIRISPTVILIKTSTIVRAMDWILDSGYPIEVISMSMGGVAKKEWATKVNELYERGIFFAAASGDCYGGLPTHRTIYPARFNRVVSVCGAQYNNDEYYKAGHVNKLMGSFGPNSVMESAMAAYTPNIPWAKAYCTPENGKNTGFSLQGAGTSAATPQVAAAAALYMKKYRNELKDFKGWEKVEAVRYALFRSAYDLPGETDRSFKYFGQGILRAKDALAIVPDKKNIRMSEADSVSFPFFHVLFKAAPGTDYVKQEMFELELLQLSQKNKDLDQILGERTGLIDLTDKEKSDFVDVVLADATASVALKQYLREVFRK